MTRSLEHLARYAATAAAGMLLSLQAAPVSAQIDYRNLDDDWPVVTEDAYPVERYAFEFLAPYRFEAESGGGQLHLVVPEAAYGIARNAQVGLKLPFAAVNDAAGTEWGLAGLRVFALYNFNTGAGRLHGSRRGSSRVAGGDPGASQGRHRGRNAYRRRPRRR